MTCRIFFHLNLILEFKTASFKKQVYLCTYLAVSFVVVQTELLMFVLIRCVGELVDWCQNKHLVNGSHEVQFEPRNCEKKATRVFKWVVT